MHVKDTHARFAFALFTGLLLFGRRTAIAVVNPSQYSRFPAQSYYQESLSSYGNEQQNYFDSAGELSSATGYANEPYKHQQYSETGYTGTGGGYDDGGYVQPAYHTDAHQLHPNFQNSISEHYLPDQGYFERSYADGTDTSSQLSFDNIDFNNSETMPYKGDEEDALPPADFRAYHRHQQPHTAARQDYAPSADYMTANNNVSPSAPSRMSSPHEGKIPKDSITPSNAAATAAVAQMTVAAARLPPPPPARASQVHARNQNPYTENENQQQHQRDQYHFSRAGDQHRPLQLEADSSNASLSRTYYLADGDLSAPSSSQLNTDSLSVLHSHLVQLPVVSAPTHSPVPSLPNYGIPSEPITISKHVEITKHVPIPVVRQVHIPYRKPVRIEIPRPVLTTIPRPYPIHIPAIGKPVAIPLLKEVKIPIEKVTPYPVEHKVPYVVEKRVPFQIEKHIASPVYYPFPVRVPLVRTIVHKKKSHLPLRQYRPRIHF